MGLKLQKHLHLGMVKFDKIILSKKNVIEIISCVDDDGNTWYQVPFLAQDTVFKDIENNSTNTLADVKKVIKPLHHFY